MTNGRAGLFPVRLQHIINIVQSRWQQPRQVPSAMLPSACKQSLRIHDCIHAHAHCWADILYLGT